MIEASAMLSGVTPKLRLNAENAEVMAKMRTEFDRISPLLNYYSAPSWGANDVAACIRDFRRRLGMGNGVVIYDWFRLPAGDIAKNQQQWQTLTILAQSLKQVAMECRLPVLAASQQNRGAIGVPLEGMCDGVAQFAGGADGIAHFASCSVAIYPTTPELVAGFAADDRWKGKPAPATQLLAIGGNRMGDSRTLIPLVRRDDLVFREVTDPDALTYVESFRTGKRKSMKRVMSGPKLPDVPAVAVAA